MRIFSFEAGMFLGAVIAIVVFGFTMNAQTRRYQSEAIKRGYARMVVTDSLSGATEFKWGDEK